MSSDYRALSTESFRHHGSSPAHRLLEGSSGVRAMGHALPGVRLHPERPRNRRHPAGISATYFGDASGRSIGITRL